jgi:hypothetical protein
MVESSLACCLLQTRTPRAGKRTQAGCHSPKLGYLGFNGLPGGASWGYGCSMRACLWVTLGCLVGACGGSAFTTDGGSGSGGTGGDGEAGRTAGRGGTGGSTGGKPGTGGSPQGGAVSGGSLGTAGAVAVGGSATTGGAASGGTEPDPSDASCPKDLPTPGAACADGLSCSYGMDLRPSCRRRAKCDGSRWVIDNSGDCDVLPECQGVVQESECDDSVSPPCHIDGYVYCVCTGCSGVGPCGSETRWKCAAGSGPQTCPHVLPNDGQACSSAQLECPYGSCATENPMSAACDGSTWVWQNTQCPQ